MRSVSYRDIEKQEPEFLIPGLVQLGGVTYVMGDGGVGKSFLTADWAARITTGSPMPGEDQEPLPQGTVVLVSAEDSPEFAMSWRLGAAGANMDYVFDMTDEFELPGSLGLLREDLAEINDPRSEFNIGRRVAPVRMVVIDPLADVASISLTSGAVKIRRALTNPLRDFARQTGIAVVVVCHTTKNGRMAGSAAIEQAARMVLRVRKSAANPDIRVIAVEKTNNARDDLTLGYRLVGEGMDSTRVEYMEIAGGATPARELTGPEKIMEVLRHSAGLHPHPALGCPDCKANRENGTGDALQIQEIMRRAGTDYAATRTALSRAKTAGEVISGGRGLYTVPETPETAETAPGVPAGVDMTPADDSHDGPRVDPLADHCDPCMADDHEGCTGEGCACTHHGVQLHVVRSAEDDSESAEATDLAEVAAELADAEPAEDLRSEAPRENPELTAEGAQAAEVAAEKRQARARRPRKARAAV